MTSGSSVPGQHPGRPAGNDGPGGPAGNRLGQRRAVALKGGLRQRQAHGLGHGPAALAGLYGKALD